MKPGKDYVGVFVGTFVHNGEGEYLFGYRTKNCRDEQERWDLAGGGTLEFGETLESAVRRELKEEIGAEASKIEFLGTREVFREHDGKNTHWIGFDYRVLVNPKEVEIGEPEMCSELRWSSLNEIPNPRQSQMDYKINKYSDKL